MARSILFSLLIAAVWLAPTIFSRSIPEINEREGRQFIPNLAYAVPALTDLSRTANGTDNGQLGPFFGYFPNLFGNQQAAARTALPVDPYVTPMLVAGFRSDNSTGLGPFFGYFPNLFGFQQAASVASARMYPYGNVPVSPFSPYVTPLLVAGSRQAASNSTATLGPFFGYFPNLFGK